MEQPFHFKDIGSVNEEYAWIHKWRVAEPVFEFEVKSNYSVVSLQVRLLAQSQSERTILEALDDDGVQVPAQDRYVESGIRLGPGGSRSC